MTEQGTQDTDDAPLAPDTIGLLEAILRGAPEPAPVHALPDTAGLVGYLSGALTSDEQYAIESALVRHRALRDRLRATHATMKTLQSLTWSEAAQRAEESGEMGETARAWRDLAVERMRSAPIAARSGAPDWAKLRAGIASGTREAIASWQSFQAFAQQWRLALSRPRVAMVKGSAADVPRLVGVGPEAGRVDADIDAEGALRVTLKLPSPSPAAEPTARLFLAVAGQVWLLAAEPVQEGRVDFRIPGIGALLDLPPGSIPPALLEIAVGEAPAGDPAGRIALLAEVAGRDGRPGKPPVAEIELLGEPRCEAGQLSLTVALPAVTRLAFIDGSLELELIVGPRAFQHLGAWPVRLWQDRPLALTVSAPDCPDAAIPFISYLRARLKPDL